MNLNLNNYSIRNNRQSRIGEYQKQQNLLVQSNFQNIENEKIEKFESSKLSILYNNPGLFNELSVSDKEEIILLESSEKNVHEENEEGKNESNLEILKNVGKVLGLGFMILGGAGFVVGVAASAIGFGTAGIVGGSIASGIQSSVGSVVAGSLFATCQSLGATGAFVSISVAGAATAATGDAIINLINDSENNPENIKENVNDSINDNINSLNIENCEDLVLINCNNNLVENKEVLVDENIINVNQIMEKENNK